MNEINKLYVVLHPSLEFEFRELVENQERQLSNIVLESVELVMDEKRRDELIENWNTMDVKRECIPTIICYNSKKSYERINKLWNTVIFLTTNNFNSEWNILFSLLKSNK